MTAERYDLVLCIGKQHLAISQTTIKYIIKFLNPAYIYVVTHHEFFYHFQDLCIQHDHIVLIDERELDENVSFENIYNFINKHTGEGKRTGWYFQQFLKMQAHRIVKATHYLIWDADSIPLRPIPFFDSNNCILIHPGKEYHLPYFDTLTKLLQIGKQTPHSFISEHMMVEKSIMKSFVDQIQALNPNNKWPLTILEYIDLQQLALSGFSEYESFGSFLMVSKPSSIRFRENETEKIKTYRFGSQIFGQLPSENDLKIFQTLGFHYVTFETWDKTVLKTINQNKRKANIYCRSENNLWMTILRKRILRKIEIQIKNN